MKKIDQYIWMVTKWLMERYGVDEGCRLVDPLSWYVRTGRSTLEWEKALLKVKPFVIARICAKDLSYDDTIKLITKKFKKHSI